MASYLWDTTLEFTVEQQRQEAINRAGKMSIQGVQLKLSAVLRVSDGRFEIVDKGGRYILKPQSVDYPQLPENEDLTMHMASAAGIEAPLHALLRSSDGSLTYFIKRFDREGRTRVPLEDFAQLTGKSRDTKYDSSMEQVAAVIDQFCTFPVIERVKLFERTLFSFLTGNEDMHLKNFSLITRDQKVELAPAYDFLSTTLAMKNPKEELALPIRGKKSRLTPNDLMKYFARERLQLNDRILGDVVSRFMKAIPLWRDLLARSFLSEEMKQKFALLLDERTARLQF
ncbi:MAG TPA: HipA domain-containing protein [Verrucomicrobiae bacterium]|jgi:serine/threonine-protein kinase HipA|nr:HipA domain-containing protein [Verrucomicrobiae bacterium]